jgi:meromycolic acid enoyl-[acyl-carrier-protein] reductase
MDRRVDETQGTPGLLAGRRLLLSGVVNTDSIAYATAVAAKAMGASLLLTAPARDLEMASATASGLGEEVVELDVNDDDGWDRLAEHVRATHGALDGALHAIAWSPPDGLAGRFAGPPPSRLALSFDTSVASYVRMGGFLADVAPCDADGRPLPASLVGLTFDASRAWGIYNWMGVMKAALDTANRFLARDLGPSQIRTNVVAAGPLNTRAAGGIPGFATLLESWERAPLGWDADDATPVADTICFLLSDLSRAITGQVIHVDGGHSAVQGGAYTPEA